MLWAWACSQRSASLPPHPRPLRVAGCAQGRQMSTGVSSSCPMSHARGRLQGFAGALFFWTYMLLVFLVLLNFLLAIIVDAFTEVRRGKPPGAGGSVSLVEPTASGFADHALDRAPARLPACLRRTRQVKERTKESTGIHTELARLLADQWRGVTSMLPGGPARAGRKRLDALLRAWAGPGAAAAPGRGAGSDGGEGEEGGGGKGGGATGAGEAGASARVLEVGGAALDEATLARVLGEALAPFDAAGGEGGEASKAASGGDPGSSVSAEELTAIARLVLHRFGGGRAVNAGGDHKVRRRACASNALGGPALLLLWRPTLGAAKKGLLPWPASHARCSSSPVTSSTLRPAGPGRQRCRRQPAKRARAAGCCAGAAGGCAARPGRGAAPDHGGARGEQAAHTLRAPGSR